MVVSCLLCGLSICVTSSLTIRLDKPCRADEMCEGPYSYRHFLSLTNNTAAFSVSETLLCQTVQFDICLCLFKLVLCTHIFNCQMAVNQRNISGELDPPEGGLDGLLQAVVCQDVSPNHTNMLTHTHTFFTCHQSLLSGTPSTEDWSEKECIQYPKSDM